LEYNLANSDFYQVRVSKSANYDLQNIADYYLLTANNNVVLELIKRIEKAFKSLTEFPDRGSEIPEMVYIGILQYKQLLADPFRIIYRIKAKQAEVFMVLHQKQSIKKALSQRNLYQ
jgi:toxin ParE1/3/4